MYFFVLMFSIVPYHTATATTYTVTPDSHVNTSLQFYVSNVNEYFISHNQLKFLPGMHYLQSDLVIHNIANFTMTGNNSTIVCNGSQIGLSIIKVKGFTLQRISLHQCSKDYSRSIDETLNFHSHDETIPPHWIAALHIQYCTAVNIKNMSLVVNTGVNGLVAVNVMETFSIINVQVYINCSKFGNRTMNYFTNGIVLYFYDQAATNDSTVMAGNFICIDDNLQLNNNNNNNNVITIKNLSFITTDVCLEVSQNVLNVVLTQLLYNITIRVGKSSFSDLHNASVLYYYGESCGTNINSTLVFKNCQIHNNAGDVLSQLFLILAHNNGSIFSSVEAKQKCDRRTNLITFINSTFINNSNIRTLISIVPINTLMSNFKITIKECKFYHNYVVQLIKSQTYARLLWQMSHYIVVQYTNISFNKNDSGLGLISLTNGMLKFNGIVNIKNNSYYTSIVHLYLSVLKLHGFSDISYNTVRNVIKAREGSYYILKVNAKVVIKRNIVHSVLSEAEIHNEEQGEICNLQFVSNRKNLDKLVAKNETLNFSMAMIDNIYTAPTHLLHPIFVNCTWLADMAFQTAKSSAVFSKVVTVTDPIHIDKANIGIIPSTICKCTNFSSYNCTSHELGEAYPGQTLTVSLIVPHYGSIQSSTNIPLTLKADTTKQQEDGCIIIEPTEVLQAYSDYGCNWYNFTVWSKLDSHECELYLTGDGEKEIFYIKLLPCPLGFSLQIHLRSKTCSCDNNLMSYLSVAPCDLNDGTIHRPAHTWITGYASHSYVVSLHCPFDYCLPHSSRLNLLTPNSQCQFRRTGVICGHCQDGLSTVFGSSHCEQCSSVYLLITIPIAVAGVVLVLMLFIFNLTVTNGAINTFIFYVNIISINISMFFPKCHTLICITVSLSNLDLGFETCFYNGMDGYAKMWLQLLFPFYLIAIALALIMGSRYSTRVQRLTAQRGLPVLATLFLLSYTKILMTVCHVLFFFTFITQLPGKHSELVWSVDTSTPTFGAKFIVLFTVCVLLLLVLLPFNILLLFTRMLSRFKFINTFKPLLDAYFGSYRDSFFYWTGLQLLMRAIFFGLSALDKDTSLTIGIMLLGIMLCVQGVLHPFKSRFKNVQESLILLNLLAVYVTALYNNTDDKTELPVVKHLIIVVLVYFIMFITYHCITTMFAKRVERINNTMVKYFLKWKEKFTPGKEKPGILEMESFSCKIPDVARNYKEFQEPLIALND